MTKRKVGRLAATHVVVFVMHLECVNNFLHKYWQIFSNFYRAALRIRERVSGINLESCDVTDVTVLRLRSM